MSGKLIVLEGIDGSGKSSHARLLCERLTAEGIDAVRTFEPTDGAVGGLLRRYLRGELSTDERAIAALFLADRLDHITKPDGLRAMLAQDKMVICDRYLYSSVAYNCASEGVEWVAQLNQAAHDLLAPDLVVFLDLPVAAMEQRLANRGYKEIYETVEYQRRVRERYLQSFSLWEDKVVRIDCNRPRNEVAQDVYVAVSDILQKK